MDIPLRARVMRIKLLAAINVTIKAIKRCTSNREQIKTRAVCAGSPASWRFGAIWSPRRGACRRPLAPRLICVCARARVRFDTDLKSKSARDRRLLADESVSNIKDFGARPLAQTAIGFGETRLNAQRAVSVKCPQTHSK